MDDVRSWTHLPEGTLPCMACGIAVSAVQPERVETLEILLGVAKGGYREDGYEIAYQNSFEAEVTRCDHCWQIYTSAIDMLSANPDVRRAIGSPEIALYRLDLALGALDALGVTDPRVIDKNTGSSRELRRLIEHMAPAGGLARWTRHAKAAGAKKALDTAPNAERWGHLTTDERTALNAGRVAMFRERNEKPKPVGVTDDYGRPLGCMLCGVAEVAVMPSQVLRAWRAMEADSETIGGPIKPDPIEGVVCPRCDRAIDAARGVGQSAMRASILDYLGANFGPRWQAAAPDFGVVAWGALRGVKPNERPWDHIDLAPLREEFAASGQPLHGDYQPLVSTAMPVLRRGAPVPG